MSTCINIFKPKTEDEIFKNFKCFESRSLEVKLLYACQDNNLLFAKLLLRYGVNINCLTYDHRTPLMIAVNNYSTNIVKLLINLHANPNIQDNTGENALDIAKRKGLKAIEELLEAKMNVYQQQVSQNPDNFMQV